MADHEGDTAELERRLGEQEKQAATVVADMRSLSSSVERLSRTVETIASRVASREGTNWMQVFGAAGIVLTLGGMLFAGYAREQGRMQVTLDGVVANDRERQYDRGRVDERVARLGTDLAELGQLGREEVRQLDDRLQREMRELDATAEAKREALEKRVLEVLQRDIDRHGERIEKLDDLQRQVRELASRNTARIDALEKVSP